MFIIIYAYEFRHPSGSGMSYQPIESELYLSPLHIVWANPETKEVRLTDGTTIITDKEGVQEVRRSTQVCAEGLF